MVLDLAQERPARPKIEIAKAVGLTCSQYIRGRFMQSVLNIDSNVKAPTAREALAGRSANWLRSLAIFYAATFAAAIIPVVGAFAGLVHIFLAFLYPANLLVWLVMYVFRLDRSNYFNRRTYRDVLISVALWLGTIIAQIGISIMATMRRT